MTKPKVKAPVVYSTIGADDSVFYKNAINFIEGTYNTKWGLFYTVFSCYDPEVVFYGRTRKRAHAFLLNHLSQKLIESENTDEQ